MHLEDIDITGITPFEGLDYGDFADHLMGWHFVISSLYTSASLLRYFQQLDASGLLSFTLDGLEIIGGIALTYHGAKKIKRNLKLSGAMMTADGSLSVSMAPINVLTNPLLSNTIIYATLGATLPGVAIGAAFQALITFLYAAHKLLEADDLCNYENLLKHKIKQYSQTSDDATKAELKVQIEALARTAFRENPSVFQSYTKLEMKHLADIDFSKEPTKKQQIIAQSLLENQLQRRSRYALDAGSALLAFAGLTIIAIALCGVSMGTAPAIIAAAMVAVAAVIKIAELWDARQDRNAPAKILKEQIMPDYRKGGDKHNLLQEINGMTDLKLSLETKIKYRLAYEYRRAELIDKLILECTASPTQYKKYYCEGTLVESIFEKEFYQKLHTLKNRDDFLNEVINKRIENYLFKDKVKADALNSMSKEDREELIARHSRKELNPTGNWSLFSNKTKVVPQEDKAAFTPPVMQTTK